MSIKRTDRMREVLSLLRDRGEVASQVLCTELSVSAATLRRDLSELEEQGLLVRTHGGARALDPSGSEIPVVGEAEWLKVLGPHTCYYRKEELVA